MEVLQKSMLLIIEKITNSIWSSYTKLVYLKFSLQKKIFAKLYTAVALPHLLHVLLIWDWFIQTKKLGLWSVFCKYLMFLIRYLFHGRNTFFFKIPKHHGPLWHCATLWKKCKEKIEWIMALNFNLLTLIGSLVLKNAWFSFSNAQLFFFFIFFFTLTVTQGTKLN